MLVCLSQKAFVAGEWITKVGHLSEGVGSSPLRKPWARMIPTPGRTTGLGPQSGFLDAAWTRIGGSSSVLGGPGDYRLRFMVDSPVLYAMAQEGLSRSGTRAR
jgi:hypothetical protein